MSPMKIAVATLLSSTVIIICCDDMSETALDTGLVVCGTGLDCRTAGAVE